MILVLNQGSIKAHARLITDGVIIDTIDMTYNPLYCTAGSCR